MRGRAKATVNDVTKIYGPEDGLVTFEKFDVHNFSRADVDDEQKDDGPVEVMEWTDPGTILCYRSALIRELTLIPHYRCWLQGSLLLQRDVDLSRRPMAR